jgi:hypothetical protein
MEATTWQPATRFDLEEHVAYLASIGALDEAAKVLDGATTETPVDASDLIAHLRAKYFV